MNSKSILYFSFLIIGLVLSLGLVCASENIIDTQETTTVDNDNYGGVLSAGENDNLKGDIEAPDINIEGPEGKLKGPKFSMPEMNFKAPKVPYVDIKGPTVDIKGPKVDIDVPDVDVHGISMPDIDLNLKGPKVKGDVDVSVPKAPEDENGGLGSSMPGFKGEGPEVDVNLPKSPMPNFYTVDGVLRESQVQEQQNPSQQQQQSLSNLVIEKFWENNDSGSITYIEIEVYRMIIGSPVQEQHVEQQQQAGEHDILAEPISMIINGVERQVEFVGRYNITKDNDWKLTLPGFNFDIYYDYDSDEWKNDFFTYFVKEVNLPDNVFPVYSNYSRHVDNSTGLFVYWNLTNSIIPDEPVLGDEPPEEEVNETPEENETEPPAVDNPENPEVEDNSTDEITIEENKTSPTVEQSTPSAGEKKVLDVENATGNPLVLLLMVIAVLGVVVRRRD